MTRILEQQVDTMKYSQSKKILMKNFMTHKDEDIFDHVYDPGTNSVTKTAKPEFEEVSYALNQYFSDI